MRIPLRKVSLASLLLLLLLAAAGTAALTAARRQPPQEPPKVHVPKKFLSEVKRLKVESHWIEKEGTPEASLHVVVRNKSALAVTRVSVTISDLTIGRGRLRDPDEPVSEPVIEPYGTTEFNIGLTNFIDDAPFVITAAFYADGTEEGREQILKWAHEDDKEEKAKRAAKKGGPEQ